MPPKTAKISKPPVKRAVPASKPPAASRHHSAASAKTKWRRDPCWRNDNAPARAAPIRPAPARAAPARAAPAPTRAAPAPTQHIPFNKYPKALKDAIQNADVDYKVGRSQKMEAAFQRGDPNWKYVNRWELPKSRPKAEQDAWRRTHDPTYKKTE